MPGAPKPSGFCWRALLLGQLPGLLIRLSLCQSTLATISLFAVHSSIIRIRTAWTRPREIGGKIMANSVTIHSTANGNSYALTLQKTGSNTGTGQLQQVNPPGSSYTANLTGIKANGAGTQLTCQANVSIALFHVNCTVNCTVNNNTPGGPTVNVAITSTVFNHTDNYQITPADSTALSQFLIASQFPPLT
jgi:hypothetical protein